MGKIIAVANLKGGVGKSVLSTNLACALRGVGRVVLVDTDHQQSTVWWGRKGGLVEVVSARETEDKRAWAGRLREVVGDLTVIDCGSNDPHATALAFAVADMAVVPCAPAAVDLKATRDTLDALRGVRRRRDGLPPVLLVPSRVDRRRASGREIEAALHDFDEPVAPAIVERAAFSDAFAASVWIGEFSPRSAGHTEVEALAAIVRRRLWPESASA